MVNVPIPQRNGTLPYQQESVEVVVPVYNEQEALPKSIPALCAYLETYFPFRWSVLIAPTVWAAYTVWQGNGSPSACTGPACAGPRTAGQESSWGGSGGPTGGSNGHADPALLDCLQTNRGEAKYLVATVNSFSAAPIILGTDYPVPVIDLGGYVGSDPVLSNAQLANLVKEGEVRFFLLGQDHQSSRNESMSWVQDNCLEVPGEQWQSSSSASEQGGGPGESAPMLYDCSTYGSG
jgi:hypothetical protein